MKKKVLSLLALAAFVAPMLIAGGCVQNQKAGGDMYKAVPKVVHEQKFPAGHPDASTSGDPNCIFDKAGDMYFCQF